MIRKQSREGVGYSVVELSGARHVFAAATARHGSTLAQQVDDALRVVQAVMAEEGTHGSIVHQAVFLPGAEQVEPCRRMIREFYRSELPATSYILQPPCDGKLVAIEALGVGRDSGGVEIERHGESLVITRHDGVAWLHCADVRPQTSATSVYDRSIDAFSRMQRQLAEHGVAYDQVVRTWLYLGDIVGPEGRTQRYKELNRARTDFYRPFRFGVGHTPPGSNGAIYPASTGIGTEGRDVVMSCIGVTIEKEGVTLAALENPVQTSAFDYGDCYGQKSPKFARAMAVAGRDSATIFVSGTASITASETRHVGDAAKQTEQTLENIAALVSAENLDRHGVPGLGATLDDLALVRVYIKRPEDYPKARAVCRARLGELPAIYALADVCRPDLLVEIEAVAFASPR